MDNDKIGITLSVIGEKLTLTIERKDEEFFRAAQKRVAETIETYKKLFEGTKENDNYKKILIMACISEAYNYEKAKLDNGKEDLQLGLEAINKELYIFNSENNTEKKK